MIIFFIQYIGQKNSITNNVGKLQLEINVVSEQIMSSMFVANFLIMLFFHCEDLCIMMQQVVRTVSYIICTYILYSDLEKDFFLLQVHTQYIAYTISWGNRLKKLINPLQPPTGILYSTHVTVSIWLCSGKSVRSHFFK